MSLRVCSQDQSVVWRDAHCCDALRVDCLIVDQSIVLISEQLHFSLIVAYHD